MANRGRHRKIRIHLKEQKNKADLTAFIHNRRAHKFAGRFSWNQTIEGHQIWHVRLINNSTI